MTDYPHRVRDFVVRELPRFGGPLPPEQIAASLGLDLEQVKIILGRAGERRLSDRCHSHTLRARAFAI